jgi:hypothetical protein
VDFENALIVEVVVSFDSTLRMPNIMHSCIVATVYTLLLQEKCLDQNALGIPVF